MVKVNRGYSYRGGTKTEAIYAHGQSQPRLFMPRRLDYRGYSCRGAWTIVGESTEGYDLLRTLRMAGYGMLILGPSLHYWFNFVSRVFPKRDLLSTFKKIALGQTVYGPAMTVIFFSVNAALQGESGTEIVARLKRYLVPTMIGGVMYGPICDFVTFKFIPVHLQPLVSNSFSYLWTIYMTYMANLEKVGTE
ncbi:Peroxisomal membrane 22 kDa (Mpv17/PMP22) family protein [Abeliophyllum distichum]|uniref:Peroxisomal membrane 22 kDa (Mpv17/PMP22) family protein n=1 Tax=Abeliophyllum distichum TaxID=126358 RepID=A0ABD1TH72_9LAMI